MARGGFAHKRQPFNPLYPCLHTLFSGYFLKTAYPVTVKQAIRPIFIMLKRDNRRHPVLAVIKQTRNKMFCMEQGQVFNGAAELPDASFSAVTLQHYQTVNTLQRYLFL